MILLREDSALTRENLINYGFTPECPGCYAAHHGGKYKSHTEVCRSRIRKALMEDDTAADRVADVKLRENAWLERRLIEHDKGKERVVPEAPNHSDASMEQNPHNHHPNHESQAPARWPDSVAVEDF